MMNGKQMNQRTHDFLVALNNLLKEHQVTLGADLNGIHALSEDGEIDLELDQFFYEKEYK